MRFWNNDVLTNIEGVIEKIKETLGRKDTLTLTSFWRRRHPHPNPLPQGRGKECGCSPLREREEKENRGQGKLKRVKGVIKHLGMTEEGERCCELFYFFPGEKEL